MSDPLDVRNVLTADGVFQDCGAKGSSSLSTVDTPRREEVGIGGLFGSLGRG